MVSPLDTVIESDRLRLVPTSEAHAEDILREFTAEITAYMFPKSPDSLDEVLTFIRGARERMRDARDLTVAVLDKHTGEYLGNGGVHELDGDTPELGIWLKKGAHGHHYGREAVTALVRWAERNVTYRYLIYPVDRRNVSSRKIPESLGGLIEAEYEQTGGGGQKLSLLEYRIYPPANE